MEAIFAIPGRLETPTGGYMYDRRVMALMPSLGVNARYLNLPGHFPNPSGEDLQKVRELLFETPKEAKLIIDGLALGVLPKEILEPIGERVIALIHKPLATKSGLSEDRRAVLRESEKIAFSLVQHIIATSTFTREHLIHEYAISPARITVAEPGTDPAPRASGTGTPLQLLSVGALEPRKGYSVLIDALVPLKHLDWRLTIVGDLDRDQVWVEGLRDKISQDGLQNRVHLAGIVVPATLERLYDSADIFVQTCHVESFGTALSEAMVRGLTIVSSAEGLNDELPGMKNAVLMVLPRDTDALQEALEKVLQDRKLRGRLADAAWDVGRRIPTWNETARRIGAVIMGLEI